MEKNNQPLIITAIIGGIVLIIALAFIFTRNSDETTTTTDANNTTENGTNGDSSQPPAPTPAPTPTPTPQPAPTPTPNPTPAPDPQPSVLPANWDSLTSQGKTDLNPFDCDHETQWVSAENGSCIEKATRIREDDIKLDARLEILREEDDDNDDIECTYHDNFDDSHVSCLIVVAVSPTQDIGLGIGEWSWLQADSRTCVLSIPDDAFNILTAVDRHSYNSRYVDVYAPCKNQFFNNVLAQDTRHTAFVEFSIPVNERLTENDTVYLSVFSNNPQIILGSDLVTNNTYTVVVTSGLLLPTD